VRKYAGRYTASMAETTYTRNNVGTVIMTILCYNIVKRARFV